MRRSGGRCPHGRSRIDFHRLSRGVLSAFRGCRRHQGHSVTAGRPEQRTATPRMNIRRARCCVSVLAGFLAIAVNLIAALVMGPMAPSMQAGTRFDVASAAIPDGRGPQSGIIPICSAQGTRWVTADGAPALPPPGGGGHSDLCAFCLPLTSGGVTAPADEQIIVSPPSAVVVAYRISSGRPAAGGGFNPSARPRAPPALV